jgi:5'-nucleotidase
MVTGVPLDPAKLYGMVSDNCARGGDDVCMMGIDMQDACDFGPDLADGTAEYLAVNAP